MHTEIAIQIQGLANAVMDGQEMIVHTRLLPLIATNPSQIKIFCLPNGISIQSTQVEAG